MLVPKYKDKYSELTPIVWDGEDITMDVADELDKGRFAQTYLAMQEAERVAQTVQKIERKYIDNFGEVVCTVPIEVFVHYFKKEKGMCWHNNDWLKWFKRTFPQFSVKSKSPFSRVSFAGCGYTRLKGKAKTMDERRVLTANQSN